MLYHMFNFCKVVRSAARKCTQITCALILLSCTYAVSAVDTPPPPPLSQIRIGVMGPLSGDYAAYGMQVLSGAMQLADEVNANGGIHGLSVQVIPFDDQCNPDLAVRQALDIVRQYDLHAVIGPVCSAVALAVAPIYAQANILAITPSATNQEITQRNLSNIFRMSGTDIQQSEVAANFLIKQLKAKKIAILHDQDLYSKNLADRVAEHLTALDNPPSLYQACHRGTRNFTNIVKKLKTLQIDAIYFAGLYPETAALADTLHSLQLQIPILSADANATHKLLETTSSVKVAANIMFTFTANLTTNLATQKLIATLQQQQQDPVGYTLYAYAAMQAITTAIQQVNNTNSTMLSDWLHSHTVNTILGQKSWDTNGDINDHQFAVYSWNEQQQMIQIN